MRKTLAHWLLWIDNNINHPVIDRIFDKFAYNKNGEFNETTYWIWKKTSRRFCNFAVDFFDKWG